NILSIFAIWIGGSAIYGGLITGAIFLYFFTQYRFINTLYFLDIVAPSVMIAKAKGLWGNLFNQEAYGNAVESLNYLPA
ncbi:prolipoprotein diacylglyceryl transferase family protein, partial [Streptococcus suis]